MPKSEVSVEMNSAEMNSRDRAASNVAVVATAGAILTLLPVAARQVGLIQHLPDPPGGIFDSDRITTSRMAHPFGVPDALVGLGSYGITLGLLLAARHKSYAKPLLRAKLKADAAAAATKSHGSSLPFAGYAPGARPPLFAPRSWFAMGGEALVRSRALLAQARTPFPAAMAS